MVGGGVTRYYIEEIRLMIECGGWARVDSGVLANAEEFMRFDEFG